MKKVFFLFVTILCLHFNGFSQTSIINSWTNPNVVTENLVIHKMVIAALLYDQGVRREVEDYLVSQYPGTATQSYLLMGDSLVTDENAAGQRLKDLGYDGILIMKRSGNDNQQQYIPGRPPTEYTTWGGYWGYWGGPRWVNHYNPGTPGHTVNVYTGLVQVNLYSLNSNTLLYSANTSTTRPGGTLPLFEDVANAIDNDINVNKVLLQN